MRMKRILSVFLMLALILAGLAGCQGGAGKSPSEPAAQPVNMEPTDEFVIYRPPYTPDWLRDTIVLFRQVYPDVEVTIEDFSTTGDYEERREQYESRVNSELTAGGGPDIIFLGDLSLNPYKAMRENFYLDLTPFLEQDKYFSEDNFLPGVFDAGRYKGKQYIVPVNVRFPMFIARTPVLEQLGIDQVATEDTAAFLKQIGEKSPQAQAELGFDRMMERSKYFSYFLAWANLKLVDYENRQVCPEPEKVRSFMEAYKTYYEWDYSNEGTNIRGDIAFGAYDTDKIPFLPKNFCYQALGDHRINFRYRASDYLEADGSYREFLLRDMEGKANTLYGDQVAIPVTSKNQLNAYRFIQLLLSESIQKKLMTDPSGFYESWLSPVNREVMEAQIREEMSATQNPVYRNNEYIGIIKAVPATDWLDHIEKLNSVDSSVIFDDTVIQMVWEAMEPFFKDEKPYESCFDELKSKLTIYMDE